MNAAPRQVLPMLALAGLATGILFLPNLVTHPVSPTTLQLALRSLTTAGLVALAAHLAFASEGLLVRAIGVGLLVAGMMFSSAFRLYADYGWMRFAFPDVEQYLTAGAYWVPLAIICWFPRRWSQIPGLSAQRSIWVSVGIAVASIGVLYLVSRGIGIWFVRMRASDPGMFLTSPAFVLANLSLRASLICYVMVLPRVLPRRMWLWVPTLVLGLLLTCLRPDVWVYASLETCLRLESATPRLIDCILAARRVIAHWPYAPLVGAYLATAGIAALFLRRDSSDSGAVTP